MSAMSRWDPSAETTSLRDAMGRLLEGSVVRPGLALGAGTASFPVNLYRAGDELRVEALLPGVGPEDIDVSVHQGVLTIAARRHGWQPREGERAYLQEIGGGEVTRSFSLPFPVDAGRVSADYTDGVLTLTLPVAEEAKPKRIAIGAGQQRRLAADAQSG